MNDTAIVGENVGVVQAGNQGIRNAVSWSVVIAATGAMIATAPRAGATLASAAVEGPAAAATSTAGSGGGASSQADPFAYYVDALLRASPPREATAAVPRDQMTRIVARAVAQGRLADDDRNYLAEVVASHTGLGAEEASRRVDDVVNQARESARQGTDAARQAGSYLSFWMFMSLLFGAAAGTLGGMLGGELRDNAMRASLVATN
jgi:hypothetical protein